MNKTIEQKLYSYQVQHTENLISILDKYGRACDMSDTGTGKSYTAIATILSLHCKPFIVCPKSVLHTWKNVVEYFGAECVGYSNYEQLMNCKYYKNLSGELFDIPFIAINKNGKYECSKIPKDIIIIYDEVHKCKNKNTINSHVLYELAKTDAKILILSATICDSLENFALCGFTLRMYDDLNDCARWIRSVGKGYQNKMQGVHDAIFPEHCSRMKITKIDSVFPSQQILADCYTMDKSDEIQSQYDIINNEIENMRNKDGTHKRSLAKIMYSRMAIEKLKIPTIIELAERYIDEKLAVVIFVNFTDSINTLSCELNTNCIINGEQSLKIRNKNIADFNDDKEHIIICNTKSGGLGISLHDLHGNYPRISIISPSYSAQDIIQVLGRIYRANCKTPVRQRILYCSGTIEEHICENIRRKISNISELNDGDLLGYKIEGLEIDTSDKKWIEKERNMKQYKKLLHKKMDLISEIKDIDKILENTCNFDMIDNYETMISKKGRIDEELLLLSAEINKLEKLIK